MDFWQKLLAGGWGGIFALNFALWQLAGRWWRRLVGKMNACWA
jgi:hypothetical protein